jgi:hypothetical protein
LLSLSDIKYIAQKKRRRMLSYDLRERSRNNRIPNLFHFICSKEWKKNERKTFLRSGKFNVTLQSKKNRNFHELKRCERMSEREREGKY